MRLLLSAVLSWSPHYQYKSRNACIAPGMSLILCYQFFEQNLHKLFFCKQLSLVKGGFPSLRSDSGVECTYNLDVPESFNINSVWFSQCCTIGWVTSGNSICKGTDEMPHIWSLLYPLGNNENEIQTWPQNQPQVWHTWYGRKQFCQTKYRGNRRSCRQLALRPFK